MKNSVKKSIAIFFLFAGLLFSNSLKAQATFPYILQNNLLCSIQCTYTIYDAACVAVCSNTLTIGALGAQSAPSCSASDYMIEVSVISINGTPITTAPNSPQSAPVTSDCPSANITDGGNCSTSCDAAATGTWSINWGVTGCIVQ